MFLDCPHCQMKQVNMRVAYNGEFARGRFGDKESWRIGICNNPACQRLVLSVYTGTELMDVYPNAEFEMSEAAVPEAVRADYREAGRSLTAGCLMASMVMSRRALQRCLKEMGCSQRNLVDAINHALGEGILRPPFRPLAEEIRQYGNLSAHPDDDQLVNVTRESAETVLHFVQILIHDLYEVPAMADRLRSSRVNART